MTDQERIIRGEALEGLKTHQGYKVLMEIFQELYNDAFINLKQKEDNDARARMKALDDILDEIDKTIILGNDLAKEFKKKTEH